MSKFKYLFISLILFVGISGFKSSEDPRKLILRKWKFDEKTVKGVIEELLEGLRKENPEQAKLLQENISAVEEVAKATNLEFFADGTYQFMSNDTVEKGTWKISDDNKILSHINANNEEKRKTIVEITKEKMILLDNESQKPRTYIPF